MRFVTVIYLEVLVIYLEVIYLEGTLIGPDFERFNELQINTRFFSDICPAH